MQKHDTIKIVGHKANLVPNTFIQQEKNVSKLAILFPGIGYTCQMPLLYYTTDILFGAGFDVLWVEYQYKQSKEWARISDQQQALWLADDANAAYDSAIRQRGYKQLVLVGKSLGTGAISSILQNKRPPRNSRIVWFTPLLADDDIYRTAIVDCRYNSLFIQGTSDPYYCRSRLEEARKLSCGKTLIIRGANHSLETKNKNTLQNLRILQLVMSSVQKFLRSRN